MEKFNQIKEKTIAWAKEVNVCNENYLLLNNATDYNELLIVFKNNFNWCCNHNFIESGILQETDINILNDNKIFINQECKSGYLVAFDNSTVEAYGNSTVVAFDNSTVRAYGNSTVVAYGNSYVNVFSIIEVKLSENAIARYQSDNTIKLSDESNYKIV